MDGIRKLVRLTKAFIALSLLVLLGACDDGGGEGVDVTDIPVAPAVPRGLLPSLALSNASFNGEHHAGSGTCTTCHTDPDMVVDTQVTGVQRNVSIGTAWETSIMANATRDPYWHAVVASEMDNFPNLEEVINDKCIVCHAPTAYDMASKEDRDIRLYDKGSVEDGDFLQGLYSMNDSNDMFNHGMDGVSCTLCHQMDGANFGTEEGMTGGFVVVGSPNGDIKDRPAYGQYADPGVGYMREQASFLPQLGAHISTSESCATCHNLNIEPVDPQGNKVVGAAHFAEQAVFSEWQSSDYAVGGSKEATCQDCHMPTLDQDVIIAQGADGPRPDFSEHTFLGANTVMLDMFKNYGDELGIKPGMDFDGAIERNRAFLKGAAAVAVNQVEMAADELNFDVIVDNQTGHKLPAGYHSRRVYLHVQVLDENGLLVFESGKINPNGSIVGVSEDVNPAVYEPHYNVITEETQVQVYQAIVGNVEGNRTHSLLDGSFFLKDNRLTPSGYNKVQVQADTSFPETFGTFGLARSDTNFDNGKDTVGYRLNIPSGVYTVSVELRYQPFSYGHLQKLWTQGERVDQVDMFRTIYDGTSLRDEVIDTATLVMQ